MGFLLESLGIFGIVALGILLWAYLFERWLGTTWPGLHGPFTLRQLLRDWAIYMLLFAGLEMCLERMLRLACAVSC